MEDDFKRAWEAAVARHRLLDIPGWMLPEELAFLFRLARERQGGLAVEVGSWLGRSTAVLLAGGMWVLCVDPFTGAGTDKHQAVKECCYPFQLMAKHAQTMQEHGLPMPLYWPTGDAAGFPTGLCPGLVFVDGDHSASAVQRDVRLAQQTMMGAGGLLLGHDYHTVSVQEGLAAAGVEVVSNPVGSIWVAPA